MCNVSGLVLNSKAHEPVSCRINGSVGSAGSQLPSILPLTATRSRWGGGRAGVAPLCTILCLLQRFQGPRARGASPSSRVLWHCGASHLLGPVWLNPTV